MALMAKDTRSGANGTHQSFDQKALPSTFLLIPTRNEEEAIQDLVAEAKTSGFEHILVVDGFSTDGTKAAAEAAGAKVREQELGPGKGCGVRTGMKAFLDSQMELFCSIDGDGSYIPSNLQPMIQLVVEDRADVVIGSRIRGERAPKSMPAISYASNLIVSFLMGLKFGRLFTDVQSGYWVLDRKALEIVFPKLHATGFEVELELFTVTLREKLRACEVPAGYRVRKGSTKFDFILRIRNLFYALRYLLC